MTIPNKIKKKQSYLSLTKYVLKDMNIGLTAIYFKDPSNSIPICSPVCC